MRPRIVIHNHFATRDHTDPEDWAKLVSKGKTKQELVKLIAEKRTAAEESVQRAAGLSGLARTTWKSDGDWHLACARALERISRGV